MERKTFKNVSKLLILILILGAAAGLLSACNWGGYGADEFDAYCDELFLAMLRGDAFSINVFLDNPAEYGLENEPSKLSRASASKSEYEESHDSLASISANVLLFNFKSLSAEQKKTYNVLLEYFTNMAKFKSYYYFQDNYLGSYMGKNATLPVYLDKYEFKHLYDVTNYIALMNDAPDAFASYVQFERIRCGAGYGRADYVYEGIISQCESFVKLAEGANEHYLIADFEKKLSDVSINAAAGEALFSDSTTYDYYLAQNRIAVANLLEAYQSIVTGLNQIIADYPTATRNQQGLAHYNGGKQYYELLFKDSTSSSDSVENAYNTLVSYYNASVNTFTQQYNALVASLAGYLPSDTDEVYNQKTAAAKARIEEIEAEIYASNEYTSENLMGMLADLETACASTFPSLPEGSIKTNIRFVSKSMEDHYSPASYFKSAIDAYPANEVIYVNPKGAEKSKYVLWELLSHEGWPGHLLQNAYLKNSSAHNVRKLLGYSGYAEGWATYAQVYTMSFYPAASDAEAKVYELIMTETLRSGFLSALIDIRVNYMGDSLAEVATFLGIPQDNIKNAYQRTVEVPANAATYYYSYIKFLELKAGYSGTDLQFHTAVLSAGPMSFELLKKTI